MVFMNLNKSDSDTSPRIKFSFFSSRYKENSVDRVDFVSLIIDMICQIFDQIIIDFEWKIFAILYEGTDSLIRSHRLLEIKDPKRHGIFLYHLGPGPNYRCI